MYKTHPALRKQVVKHIEENLNQLRVCGQPMSALIAARPAIFFKRMATVNEDAEYEIICGFAHMAQVTVVVYSLHCQLPQVIFPDGRSLGTRDRAFLWTLFPISANQHTWTTTPRHPSQRDASQCKLPPPLMHLPQ